MGTNYSSGAERNMCNKFDYLLIRLHIISYVSIFNPIFVCVILIGVKSKYGSCNGNCTGFIIIKKNYLFNFIQYLLSLKIFNMYYFL